MMSYRFRRRAFLTALSGGIGLKIMLRNLESSAQGMRSPGRLLITHWPVGIVAGSGHCVVDADVGERGRLAGLEAVRRRRPRRRHDRARVACRPATFP